MSAAPIYADVLGWAAAGAIYGGWRMKEKTRGMGILARNMLRERTPIARQLARQTQFERLKVIAVGIVLFGGFGLVLSSALAFWVR
jgi:hypothetical protein